MVRKRSSSKAGVILTAETTNLTAAEQQGIGGKSCQGISTNSFTGLFSFLGRAKRALALCQASCADRLGFKWNRQEGKNLKNLKKSQQVAVVSSKRCLRGGESCTDSQPRGHKDVSSIKLKKLLRLKPPPICFARQKLHN